MESLAKEIDASPSANDTYKKDVCLGLLYKVSHEAMFLNYYYFP